MNRYSVQKLDHIAINVTDLLTSIEWYTENVGATIDYSDESWAMLDIAGVKLAMTVPEQHPPHIAFTVSDISCLGSKPRKHRDGSYFRYVNDPEGNTIELIYWPKELS